MKQNKIIRARLIERKSMVCMNVCCVVRVKLRVLHIGGIAKIIWVRQFLCRLIDGLLTREMSIQMKDWKRLVRFLWFNFMR